MNPNKYWVVHNPAGLAPHKTHDTCAEAEKEATRLAKKHPGDKFFVLGAVCCYSLPEQMPIRQECNKRAVVSKPTSAEF